MADLDDFFAKKDRKKGKTVKKFSTPDELAKKIEDTKQKQEQKNRKERQPVQGQEGEDGAPPPVDEDEWREYEVAKKDYTGLKIQPLAAGEDNQGNNASGGAQGGEGGNAGQQSGGEGGQNKSGPWNKSNTASQQDGSDSSESGESAPVAPPPAPVGGYVPPALRRLAQGAPPLEPLRRGQKPNAPDIHNEEYFPSLGGEKKVVSGGGAWSEASSGGRVRAPPSGMQPPREVPLGNRFTSLTNDS